MTNEIITQMNDDGTVTYWSVYDQVWIHQAYCIPDRELAAMGAAEQDAVRSYLRETGELA